MDENRMNGLYKFVISTLLLLGLVGNVGATVLFSNFPDPLNVGGNWLETPGAGSQEFSLGVPSTITSIDISVWHTPNVSGLPSTMSWTISTGPTGAGAIASGSSAISSAFYGTGNGFWDVYTASFSLPSISLAPGNYWVTLSSNDDLNSQNYWGVTSQFLGLGSYSSPSSGNWMNTSAAYENLLMVHGSQSVNVPEPGSFSLITLALIGLFGSARRLRKV